MGFPVHHGTLPSQQLQADATGGFNADFRKDLEALLVNPFDFVVEGKAVFDLHVRFLFFLESVSAARAV